MSLINLKEKPLSDDLPFGARVAGLNWESLKDDAVRGWITDIFERRGVIVFEDMEQSSEMQLAVSALFGPVRHHAMKGVPRVETSSTTSLMELNCHPGEADIFEIDGKQLAGWVSWHYDACYTNQLYRGGLLRAIEIPPVGGMTGFADGIQLYNAISPELRAKFETLNIVYEAKLMFMNQRFGLPETYRVISLQQAALDVLAQSEGAPRAIHPAIWRRRSGEKVLHVSPWQAAGIEGHEDPEGDALLEALCQEIYAKMTPYWHKWKSSDMLIWDNWRMIHAVSGHDPQYSRRVHRATIEGDYGLGHFEANASAKRVKMMPC
jgi:taurine dioxygenase